MDHKKISRYISRFFARIGLQFCSLVSRILPERWIYVFASIVARIGYVCASRHRKVAFESLSLAFTGEKSKQEIHQIAFSCFDTMAKVAIESLVFMERPSMIERYTHIEGIEHLNQALSQKKGVIALSAHFGNFPLLLMKLARDGYPVYAILRHMRDQWVDTYLFKRRSVIGVGSIFTQPRKQCVDRSVDALRKNHILFIQLDQNFGSGGVFVDFFGKKAATAKGPIVFALRTKAPIVPMFIFREENNQQRIVILPEEPIVYGKDNEQTIHLTAQKLTRIIESYIRDYPHEWGWIHRRWKARPKEERLQKNELGIT